MSKGGGSTNTVQQADPWSGQQPYLTDSFQQAQNLFQSGGPNYYPNATYVPFSSQTEQALGMAENRAIGGSPVEQGMQDYVTQTMQNPGGGQTQDYLNSIMGQPSAYFGGEFGGPGGQQMNQTLQGDFLNSNPYLDQTYQNAAEAMMPNINATFGGAGRTGSGTHGMSLGKGLGQLGADLYGGNYQQERARQMQAMGLASQDDLSRRGMDQSAYQFQQNLGLGAAGEANRGLGITGSLQQGAAGLAPTAAGLDWQNIAQLGNVGSQVEGMAGQALGDQMNRFNYYQNRPEDNLARYIAAIQGNYGSNTVTNQSGGGGSPLAGAAGGALTGSALAGAASSAFPGAFGGAALGPWGMIGGALLGGLLS